MQKKPFLTAFFFSLLSISIVFSTATFATPAGGTLVATVNIENASIASQQNNTINVAFTISNREGIQNGVRYGVQLISGAGTKAVVVDEKVFDESLTLAENSSVQKVLSYTAPATASGSYQLLLTVKNSANFPFAYSNLGKVTLTSSAKGLKIAPESCIVSVDKVKKTGQAFFVTPPQALEVSCSVTNTSSVAVSATPKIETRLRGSYGDIVETAKADSTLISFKASEKKTISITIPLAQKPQTYTAIINLDAGGNSSNSVTVNYVVGGVSGTISNISLDSDFYKRGEVAALSLVWFSNTKVTAEVKLTNSLGMNCGKTVEQELSPSTIEVLIPVKSTCRDPHVFVTLKEDKGAVLDQKELSIKTTSVAASESGDKMLFVVVVVLAALIILGAYIKKHKKTVSVNGTTPMSAFLPIIIAIGILSLIPTASASADVYTSIGPDGSACVTSTVDVSPRSYTPPYTLANPSDITVSWKIENNCWISVPVAFRAINDVGAGSNNPSAVLMNPITLAPGASTGALPLTDNGFDAPSPTGTYKIKFETGISLPVFVKTTEQGVSEWQETVSSGSVCPDVILRHRSVASIKVDFFSDPQGTVPFDVTGLGLRLVLVEGKSYGLPETYSLTPVVSGNSYTISPGPSLDETLGNIFPPFTFGCGGIALPNTSGFSLSVAWPPYLTWPITPPVDYGFVIAVPTVYVYSDTLYANAGDMVTIGWASSGICTGTNLNTGGAPVGSQSVSVTSSPITYSVSCSNIAGTGSNSVTVTPVPPAITFSAEPTTVLEGGTSTLSWSVANATSCTGTNFNTGGATSGTQNVSPTNASTTYTITCTGPGGSGSGSVDVTLEYPVACNDEYGGTYYCNPGQQCTGAPQWGCQ